MFSFEGAEFRYEPYPIGVIKPVMEEDLYRALVDSFPPVELFEFKAKFGNKYTLSEKFNADNYHDYIAKTEPWRELHAWVKKEAFFRSVEEMLRANYIDLDLERAHFASSTVLALRLKELSKGRWPRGDLALRSRFEFSMLPADGGYVTPHTDTPRKVITLVVSMVNNGEWDPGFGGGTEVDRPKDYQHAFNWRNEQLSFEEIEPLHTFEFGPNQCVIFIKTFNSLQCVRPMTAAGSTAMRRTLTINIEKQL